jgi:hypothetical protein
MSKSKKFKFVEKILKFFSFHFDLLADSDILITLRIFKFLRQRTCEELKNANDTFSPVFSVKPVFPVCKIEIFKKFRSN